MFFGLMLFSVVAACGTESVGPTVLPQTDTSLPLPGSTGWNGPAEGARVASVNGHAVRHDALALQQPIEATVQTAEEYLGAIVTGELLAQAAAMNPDTQGDSSVAEAWRRALARVYLQDSFEPSVAKSDISMAKISQFYDRFRTRYDHENMYTAGHLHFVCCVPSTDDCGAAAVVECFAERYTLIKDVHRQAQSLLEDAIGNPAMMEVAMAHLHETLRGEFPALAYESFSFFYNQEVPHKDQAGRYDLVDEAFADAVIPLKLGQISEPIRTEFGWHVATKFSERPARRGTLADPDVVSELQDLLSPAFRRYRFGALIKQERQKAGVTLSPEGLDVLDDYWGGGQATGP